MFNGYLIVASKKWPVSYVNNLLSVRCVMTAIELLGEISLFICLTHASSSLVSIHAWMHTSIHRVSCHWRPWGDTIFDRLCCLALPSVEEHECQWRGACRVVKKQPTLSASLPLTQSLLGWTASNFYTNQSAPFNFVIDAQYKIQKLLLDRFFFGTFCLVGQGFCFVPP